MSSIAGEASNAYELSGGVAVTSQEANRQDDCLRASYNLEPRVGWCRSVVMGNDGQAFALPSDACWSVWSAVPDR